MDPLTISLVQTKLFWEDKQANLAMLEEKINAISQETEIIILPEMFSTGFSMSPQKLAEPMDGPGVQWMRRMAAEHKVIITGSLIISENGSYYNRLIWMLPTGDIGTYDKRHLFSYAEEHGHYRAGQKKLIASIKGWKINLQICYDLRFPAWSRQSSGDNELYDLLINVANWPEARSDAWKTLLTARAIENQCYVIGVNRVGVDGKGIAYSGDSMVLDPLGNIMYHKEKIEDVFTFTLFGEPLRKVREKFPFLNDRDSIHILP